MPSAIEMELPDVLISSQDSADVLAPQVTRPTNGSSSVPLFSVWRPPSLNAEIRLDDEVLLDERVEERFSLKRYSFVILWFICFLSACADLPMLMATLR
jgi:hypothetical protein